MYKRCWHLALRTCIGINCLRSEYTSRMDFICRKMQCILRHWWLENTDKTTLWKFVRGNKHSNSYSVLRHLRNQTHRSFSHLSSGNQTNIWIHFVASSLTSHSLPPRVNWITYYPDVLSNSAVRTVEVFPHLKLQQNISPSICWLLL